MSTRSLIHKLAMSPGVAAGTKAKAELLAVRAKQIDPSSEFEVNRVVLLVNGMSRVAYEVVNTDPEASRIEFGRRSGRDGSDGRGGLRPLGRAARSVKG